MHLKISKRGERRYLSVVQNYRENGKTKTRTIESIGYADAFADRYPDPIAHFRAYVEELNEAQRASREPVTLSFARDEQIEAGGEPTAREGAGIVLAYLDALGVGAFFRACAHDAGQAPQAGRVFEMLAAERAQHVTSKLEAWQARASFPRACDFSFKEVYEALPAIARASAGLVTHMNRAYERIRGKRDASVVYLVLQSFSFATANDVDSARHLHGTGAGRPVVGLGMALDRDGVPITYWITPAAPDAADVRRTVDRLKRDLGARRVIVVAGRTPHAAHIAHDLARTGDGFINRPCAPTMRTAAPGSPTRRATGGADGQPRSKSRIARHGRRAQRRRREGRGALGPRLHGPRPPSAHGARATVVGMGGACPGNAGGRARGTRPRGARDAAGRPTATSAWPRAKSTFRKRPSSTSTARSGAWPSPSRSWKPTCRRRPSPCPTPTTCGRIS